MSEDEMDIALQHYPPPTGLVVTLLMGNPNWLRSACVSIPRQIQYFIAPQQMDLLLIINEPHATEPLVECLQANLVGNGKVWNDGNVHKGSGGNENNNNNNNNNNRLVTWEYQLGGVRFFLATTKIPLDLDFKPPKLPYDCESKGIDYIEGTRWYSNELLHLPMLQNYDYVLKMDIDVVFHKRIPFHLLHDMRLQRAVMGHTAEYTRGSPCAEQILETLYDYPKLKQQQQQPPPPSPKLCSNDYRVQRNSDQYYTNLIILDVPFWTSPPIRDFAKYLSSTQGFHRHRWTDQIFWHFAMGLVLPNFPDAVVDYTFLRCMHRDGCWWSNDYQFLEGYKPRCNNGGYFSHTKELLPHPARMENGLLPELPKAVREPRPRDNTYVFDPKQCRGQ